MVSVHGRAANVVGEIQSHRETFLLTGSNCTAPQVCRLLAEAGLGGLTVHIGQRLSYPDEVLTSGTAEALCDMACTDLAVMLVENPAPLAWRCGAPQPLGQADGPGQGAHDQGGRPHPGRGQAGAPARERGLGRGRGHRVGQLRHGAGGLPGCGLRRGAQGGGRGPDRGEQAEPGLAQPPYRLRRGPRGPFRAAPARRRVYRRLRRPDGGDLPHDSGEKSGGEALPHPPSAWRASPRGFRCSRNSA